MEVAIHSKLKHPSILELYTFFEDFEHVFLVLELAENGELQQFLRERNKPFSEYEAALILRRVVDGLLYLHTQNILHRDISLSNLLITKDMNIKIADFGLATELIQPDEKHHTLCGTPNYISPEVASRASHGLPADVWGLGCMLYTLLVGKPPFDTDGVKSTLARVVLSNYSLPAHLSSDVSDLIERLLKKNPTERIKLEEVLSHPFLSRYDLGPKLYAFNSMNHKFSSDADSGMGTITSNSGSKSDLFQVHSAGATLSNSRCSNRPNENLYNEQYAPANYRYREQQQQLHEMGSIESHQIRPEPHISFLQKFNSMELVEKYNINPKHIAEREGSIHLLSSALKYSTEKNTDTQITNKQCSFNHHPYNTSKSKAPEPHSYMLQKAATENMEQMQDSLSRHKSNNMPVALKDHSEANVRLPARFDTSRLLPTRNRT
uniref:Protein kinase domain-containing protein n=1 Tax=Anopheles maculatus TaxID=74869 RepID=A0A182S7L9_9DIPT